MTHYMISNSTVWYQEGCYQIRDLPKERYNEALDYLEKNFIPSRIIFQNIFCTDDIEFESKCEKIKTEFRQIFKNFIEDDLSMIVINNETNEIIALIVNLMMTQEMQSWDFWTVFIEEPVIEAMFELEKIIVYKSVEKLGLKKPRDSLHIFALCLSPEYKGNNWKIKLLMAAAKLAKDLELPYLTYIGYTKNDHQRALRIGMKKIETFQINEFESDESVMHLNWLPQGYNEAVYHELCLDKLPDISESKFNFLDSQTQINQEKEVTENLHLKQDV